MKIIAIGAHLDDIELGCGGTLAKASLQGHEIMMLVLSKSGYRHYSGKYGRDTKVAIKEGKIAASILGIKKLKIFNFPNKDVPYNSKLIEILNKEFDEFNPDLILTHWVHDTHKSHSNAALSTLSAGRYFNSILMYEPFPPAGRSYESFRTQLYIDITETIKTKIESLRQHKSELNKYGEEWINSVIARARLRGFELISNDYSIERYAEAFEVVRLNIDILK